MWSDAPRTPRYVWSVSAIAATALHAGGLWWARTYWQSSRDVITPAAIAVIAVPDSDVGAIAIAPDRTNTPFTPPTAPVSPQPEPQPTDIMPVPSAPQSPPSGTIESPDLAPFMPVEPAPVSPQPEPSPLPPSPPSRPTPRPAPSQAPSPPSDIPLPPSPPPPPSDPIPQPSPSEPSEPQRRLIPSLRLDPVPPQYRADPPESFPQPPPGWQESVITLIEDSACYPSLASTVSSQQVTFQLTVEEDGRVSNIGLWSSIDGQIGTRLASCLNSDRLKANMPPLVPATVGGTPIPTDLLLLTLELSFRE